MKKITEEPWNYILYLNEQGNYILSIVLNGPFIIYSQSLLLNEKEVNKYVHSKEIKSFVEVIKTNIDKYKHRFVNENY